MLRRTNVVWIIVVTAVLVAFVAMLGTARAQKAAVPKWQDRLALGEAEVRQCCSSLAAMRTAKLPS
jgi:hypothetical protein